MFIHLNLGQELRGGVLCPLESPIRAICNGRAANFALVVLRWSLPIAHSSLLSSPGFVPWGNDFAGRTGIAQTSCWFIN